MEEAAKHQIDSENGRDWQVADIVMRMKEVGEIKNISRAADSRQNWAISYLCPAASSALGANIQW